MMSGCWMPWGMPWAGGIMMLVFWAVIIAAAVWLVRWLAKGGKSAPPVPEPPLDILKRRYASGDISREEFERMKRELE